MKAWNAIDLTGKTFGDWKALKLDHTNNHGHKMYLCQCKKGHKKVIWGTNLNRGLSKFCHKCKNKISNPKKAV